MVSPCGGAERYLMRGYLARDRKRFCAAAQVFTRGRVGYFGAALSAVRLRRTLRFWVSETESRRRINSASRSFSA